MPGNDGFCAEEDSEEEEEIDEDYSNIIDEYGEEENKLDFCIVEPDELFE